MTTTDFTDVARAKAGKYRQMEIARENKAQIDALAAELLTSLRLPPKPAERILAETIAAATVRCRRLREQGRCEAAERHELARLLRSFNALPSVRATRAAKEFSIPTPKSITGASAS